MDLADWLQRIEKLHPETIELGLDRIREVISDAARRPAPLVVSVAGTNGKGSSIAMLESIWCAAGYRVAAYTSPHLQRFNERLCVAGQVVDDARWLAAFERVDGLRRQAGVALTYFEFTTLAALEIIAAEQCDVALLEVGLGGRLDAVNVVDADVALLTNVALDHQDWLGADRETIGVEKAGIFRPDRPAIVAEPSPPDSVLDVAEKTGALLQVLGRDFHASDEGDHWRISGISESAVLPKPGIAGVPLDNAAGVVAVVFALSDALPVDEEAMYEGLRRARLRGRYQRLEGPVTWVFDVAHNPASAALLAENLARDAVAGRTRMVISMLADKDCEAVGERLRDVVDDWYVGSLDVPRGLNAEALASRLGLKVAHCFDTVEAARDAARAAAVSGDRIVVSGSFHTVGALLPADC